MSNIPSCTSAPDYTSICVEDDRIGYKYIIPGYCATWEEGQDVCKENLGPEWALYSAGSCCNKDDRRYAECYREKFNGDPKQCCINNYGSTETYNNCFTDTLFKSTCDPIYRSGNSKDCRKIFEDVCVQNNIEDEYYSSWNNSLFCKGMVAINTENPEDLPWIRDRMRFIFRNYFKNGIQGSGIAGNFQNTLYNVCSQNPSACTEALIEECSKYNRESASGNREIVNFCGCYLPNSEYALYENLYGIPKNCDPLCSRYGTIQETAISNGNEIICNGNLCIIDDVTISLTNSTNGNINFTQACGGCNGTTKCSCSISGVDITVVESTMGDINLNQYCRGGVNCYTTDEFGNNKKIPCSEGEEYIPTPEESEQILRQRQETIRRRNSLIIFVGIIIGIIIILSILIIIQQYVRSTKEIFYTEYKIVNNNSISNI